MTRETVEDSWVLDMLDFVRWRHLWIEGEGYIECTMQGRIKCEFSWRYADDEITLGYYRRTYEDSESVYQEHVVRVIRTPSEVGEKRTWFECPDCGRTVRKLYLPPSSHYFLCRNCHDLSYRARQKRISCLVRLRKLEEDLETLPPGSARQLKKLMKIEAQVENLRRRVNLEFYQMKLKVDKLTQPKRRPGRPSKADLAERSGLEPEVVKKKRVKLPPGRPKTKRPYHRGEPFIKGEKKSESERVCMRCRDWREIKDAELVTLANGRSALKGHCPVCGAKITAIVKAT
jgi:ssDNA-binding Zn-finger/Zn-ribbon topoisomerase 1